MSVATNNLKCHGVDSSSAGSAAACSLSPTSSPHFGQVPSTFIAVGAKYLAHSSHQGMNQSVFLRNRSLIGVAPKPNASLILRSR